MTGTFGYIVNTSFFFVWRKLKEREYFLEKSLYA